MISGKTTLIAHVGYPTEAFKAPLIYNPWFDKAGIDAVVVPHGHPGRRLSDGAEIAVPADQHPRRAGHDAAQGDDGRACSTRCRPPFRSLARATPSCVDPTARLLGDMFDGAGFTRGIEAQELQVRRRVGSRGRNRRRRLRHRCVDRGRRRVRSSLLSDTNAASAEALAGRLKQHYPKMETGLHSNDPDRITISSSTRRRWG